MSNKISESESESESSYDNGCIVFSNHLNDAFSALESSLSTII